MDRPVFNEIMGRVRAGQSGGDRGLRTEGSPARLGAVNTLAELGQHGAAFASATEPELDYSTPSGQAFLHMLFVFSEFTRSSLKESWATSARNAIERGIHISPRVPFGYDRGDDGRLIPSAHAPAVAELFRRRGAAKRGRLAERMNAQAPRGNGTTGRARPFSGLCHARLSRRGRRAT